jgi:phosphoribosylamine--glycine ligase
MVGDDGKPRVVEYNCRLGDPETQAILPRLEADFLDLCFGAASGTLSYASPIAPASSMATATVVLASEGYPDNPRLGKALMGVTEARNTNALVFEAGIQHLPDGSLQSSGGRVLAVTGLGKNLTDARERAYQALARITLVGGFYRSDIGLKAYA